MKIVFSVQVLSRRRWRIVGRKLTNVERRLLLEEIFQKTSLVNLEIEYSDSPALEELQLPGGISHWECDMRLLLEDGKSVGYYMAAIARFPEHRDESVHIAALFELNGSVRSGYRTRAACERNGVYLPIERLQRQGEDQVVGLAFAILVDSILTSTSARKRGRTI